MKKINVVYDQSGKINSVSDTSMYFEQENDALRIDAKIPADEGKLVRAYIKASKNSDIVDVQLTGENLYSVTIGNECMSKGTMYVGFEVYDESGYVERYEPLKVYVDGFINLGNNSSENVYVVTVDVAETETLEPDASAYVANVGTQKDMRLKLGIPRGKDGEPGYSPIKGKDYFTAEEQQSLKEDVLRDVEPLSFDYYYELNTAVENYNNYTTPGLYKIRHITSGVDRTNILIVTQLTSIRACLQFRITNSANIYKRQGNLLEDGTVDNWGEWIAFATKADVDDAKAYTDGKIGDIETALDSIIAMQNELTGGVEV